MAIRSGDVLGPYTIERVLSKQGGMSQLLLAYETDRPQYKAAIKAHLTQSSNRLAYQDLLRHEVTILQELRHPGIVRVYPMRIDGKVVYTARAADRPDQPWYFAMEYLGADSLDKHLDRIVKKFPLVWSMELFYQLLTVIHFMHQSGYAHCDLKPHNILFRHPPNPSHTPDPVLVDFGSATSIAKGMDQLSFS
ncbi:MAG: protein kinase family protein, partial [Chloroflexota bacterium]